MKEQPNAFWATIFIFIGGILGIVALFAPLRENISMAIVTMASSIVTGAFGYIQGNKERSATPPVIPPVTTEETK